MSPLELEFANSWIIYLAALLFGCNVGSFLNVVVFRVPRACVGVDKPRWSFCPSCRRRLRWHENIPVFGWLRLRGRCGGCQLPISVRYPLVEAFFGLLWLTIAWRLLQPGHYDFSGFLLLSIASLWIVSAALIDWDLRLLPDQLTLSGLAFALLAAPLAPGLYGMPRLSNQLARVTALLSGPWRDAPGALAFAEWLSSWTIPIAWDLPLGTMNEALTGAALGAATLWVIIILGRLALNREVMGFGDVKFMAFLGALCGPKGALQAIALASIFGALGALLLRISRGSPSLIDGPAALDPPLLPRLLAARCTPISEHSQDGRRERRYGGIIGLALRILGGDGSIPFGPALAAGALIVRLAPDWTAALLSSFGSS